MTDIVGKKMAPSMEPPPTPETTPQGRYWAVFLEFLVFFSTLSRKTAPYLPWGVVSGVDGSFMSGEISIPIIYVIHSMLLSVTIPKI